MRFCVTLDDKNKDIAFLPVDFRSSLISFVKLMLNGTMYFNKFRERHPGFSPYVLGLELHNTIFYRDAVRVRLPLRVYFSSGISELAIAACNKAINMQGNITIFGLTITAVELLREATLSGKQVANFRIIGHAVFRGPGGYIKASDLVGLEEALNYSLRVKTDFLSKYQVIAQYTPVRIISSNLYKGVCRHYGGMIDSVKGELELSGSPEMLQILYDYGLGVRTGQGYGYVEILG